MAKQEKKKRRIETDEKDFKISNDIENDEDTKEYPEDEEKMVEMFYGKHLLGKKEEEEEEEPNEEDEEETDEKDMDDGEDEETLEPDDEEMDLDESDSEGEEKKTKKTVDKKQKKDDIENEDGFEKQSNLKFQIKKLTEKNKLLENEVNKLRAAKNVLTELGIDPEEPQQKILDGMKDVRELAEDFRNMPELVDVIGKVYNEGLGIVDESKTPQDFMPEGRFFHQDEAFEPNTDSAIAYRKWQNDLNNQQVARDKFLNRLKENRKVRDDVQKGIQKGEEILNKRLSDIKVKALNDFDDVDQKIWKDFMKAFGEAQEDVLYGAFMGYASQKGIMPKGLRQKIKKVKTKKEKDQKVTESKKFSNERYDFDKEQEQAYDELFGGN